jgi:hypothetical protein
VRAGRPIFAGLLLSCLLVGSPPPPLPPQKANANAFWNTKAPADWSIEEMRLILQQSPWATVSHATLSVPIPIHLGSAEPMREAELRERQASRYRVEPGASFEEYQAMLAEGKYIVLAVTMRDSSALADAIESKSLEKDSIMYAGRRAYKLVTVFPPTPGDPYIRYVFPREVRPNDKSLNFDIYIPGVNYPQRHIEFDLKEMMYRGKLSY